MNQQINTIREALAHIEGMEKRPGVSTGAVQFHATTAANLLRAALTELEAAMREPVAWMHWLHGPVRLFMNKDEAMMELERLNREYPVDVGARQMRPLFAAPPAQQADGPQAATIEEAARDVGKWLNERPNRPLDLRSVAMLAAHAQQAQTGAVPQGYALVPVEPTQKMVEAGSADLRLGDCTGTLVRAAECYRAMLAAVPHYTDRANGAHAAKAP